MRINKNNEDVDIPYDTYNMNTHWKIKKPFLNASAFKIGFLEFNFFSHTEFKSNINLFIILCDLFGQNKSY